MRPPLPRRAQKSRSSRLKIKVPKEIWNSYTPYADQGRSAANGIVLAATSDSGIELLSHAPRSSTNCKNKLFRFHHGGPRRAKKGERRNEITYEQPCLQPTCASCRRWHAHLLGNLPTSDEAVDGGHVPGRASPPIDPRILDGTWRHTQSRQGSMTIESVESGATISHTTPPLTPVNKSARSTQHVPSQAGAIIAAYSDDDGLFYDSHSSFVPARREWKDFSGPTSRDEKVSTPGKNHPSARIIFTSHEGKQKFKQLIRERERKEKKRDYDRARRMKLMGRTSKAP